MKHLIYFLISALLLAGFCGLVSVAESGLPLWEAVGVICLIVLFLLGVIEVANRVVEKEEVR